MSKQKEVNINDTKFNMKDVINVESDESNQTEEVSDDEIESKHKNQDDSKDEDENQTGPEINYKFEENVEEKRKRLLIINRYKNSQRFGDWLKKQGFNFNSNTLSKMTNTELETMINDIRFCIATKNTNGMYSKLSTQGVVVLENVLRPVYKIDGLSQILSNDSTYLDTVEELALEYQNYLYVQPQYRLMYCVLSSAYIVHSQHIMLEKLSQTVEGQNMIKNMANQIQNVNNNSENGKQFDSDFSERFGDLL